MEKQEFERLYMAHLNMQQREAVEAVDGAILLLAVPGSGKTTVLVTRLGYMLLCRGIEPESILTMTYTVAATREMKARFATLFGETLAERMEIRTINGLSARIIRYCAQILNKPAFELESNEGHLNQIVRDIYKGLYNDYPDDSTIKDIRTGITYVKNMRLAGDEIKKHDTGVQKFPEIYDAYNKLLRENRLMDYDDQMSYALKILLTYPQVLAYFQQQYRYICLDEAQDTSKIQHTIIRLLAQGSGNIFMVGDEDQSIYGFRAAYPDALLSFKHDYNGAKLLFMEQNYRSTPQIVKVADGFIAKSENRLEKHMFTKYTSGATVGRIFTSSRESQYEYLFELAKKCEKETAVLYRNNDSAVPLIDMLERSGTPYNCRRFDETFFSHKIIRDISDIITFSEDDKNADIFMRVYYKLGCAISRAAALNAVNASASSGKPILLELIDAKELSDFGRERVTDLMAQLKCLKDDSAETAVQRVCFKMHYANYLEQNKLDRGKLSILLLLARRERNAKDLLLRLDMLKKLIAEHENSNKVKFEFTTIHSSKGLEYERVFLLDVFDGVLPTKTRSEVTDKAERAIYEEERRLYYVAMTRAKSELYLFVHGMRSEFCGEMNALLPKLNTPIYTGEECQHKVFGKGYVLAQCEDELLVDFHGKKQTVRLKELQMAAELKNIRLANNDKLIDEDIKLNAGDKIQHKSFGLGEVLENNAGIIRVRFPSGEKRLQLKIVMANGLITKAVKKKD